MEIKYLIIHHTKRNNDFPFFVKVRHIYLRKWDTIGYHYLIGNTRPFSCDGQLYVGRPEEYVGAHAFGWNKNSLGICLIGNFNKSNPSDKQISTLIEFLKRKIAQYTIPIENILGHRELPGVTKTCPGSNVDMNIIRSLL